jgi:hypothetical protein
MCPKTFDKGRRRSPSPRVPVLLAMPIRLLMCTLLTQLIHAELYRISTNLQLAAKAQPLPLDHLRSWRGTVPGPLTARKAPTAARRRSFLDRETCGTARKDAEGAHRGPSPSAQPSGPRNPSPLSASAQPTQNPLRRKPFRVFRLRSAAPAFQRSCAATQKPVPHSARSTALTHAPR